ncbi:MAG TPA: hypothetical protein VG298_11500 [Acidimicrobiales bacterium]|jgi:hypothetical protein|nr:hypothetical protein [Acidimicrobiales bacterium]
MGEAAPGGVVFETISQSAERCGHYCWVERRLFELTGQWSTRPGEPGEPDGPEIRVRFSEWSAGHAGLAERWRARLPVRAGVEAAALVVPPTASLADVLERLDRAAAPALQLAGLATVVLPRLQAAYAEHLAHASPINQGPIRAVLAAATRSTARESERGRALLPGGLQGGLQDKSQGEGQVETWAEFCRDLEQALGNASCISPAARAS